MRRFEYHEPDSLKTASRLLTELGDGSYIIAGGTDLLVEIRERLRRVRHVVNIKRVAGLDGLSYSAEKGLYFGALVTARTLETEPAVHAHYPNFLSALQVLGSIQVRNRATVVGNICRASPSADTIPPLTADGAVVHIYGPDGERQQTLESFFTGPGKTVLRPGEIATAVSVPPPRPHSGRIYIKHGRRKAMELATVGVAVSLERQGDECTDIRVALGAVGATVLRAPKTEALICGSSLAADDRAAAASMAMDECAPISNVRSSAEYRRAMIGVLTERALEQAWENAA